MRQPFGRVTAPVESVMFGTRECSIVRFAASAMPNNDANIPKMIKTLFMTFLQGKASPDTKSQRPFYGSVHDTVMNLGLGRPCPLFHRSFGLRRRFLPQVVG